MMEVVGGDTDTKTETSKTTRCEICCEQVWKYRCPACNVITCCLKCVQEHKVKSGCTGLRNRAEFVPMKDYDDRHLLNDYRFLEETDRKSESVRRLGPKRSSRMAKRHSTVRWRARKFHKMEIHMLPDMFTRHKANLTYCRPDGSFSWSVEWQIPEKNLTIVAQHEDSMTLNEAFKQFVESDECPSCARDMYRRHKQALTFQIKLERVAGRRYEPVAADRSISSVLEGRSLVEFPTFLVAYVKTESESESSEVVMDDTTTRDNPETTVDLMKESETNDVSSSQPLESITNSEKKSATLSRGQSEYLVNDSDSVEGNTNLIDDN